MTTWQEVLNGKAFRDWLKTLTSSGRIPLGERLDPFSTSLRRSGLVSKHLANIVDGADPVHSDARQILVDLGAMHLFDRENGAATALGKAVMSDWRAHGITDESDDHEVARCLVLVQHGLGHRDPYYFRMAQFWEEIRERYDVTDLFLKPYGLYLLSYLNQDINGFNPWVVLRALPHVLPRDAALELDAIATALKQAGDKPDAEKLWESISGTRFNGRKWFCMGLEAKATRATEIPSLLEKWRAYELLSPAGAEAVVGLHDHATSIGVKQTPEIEELLLERHNVVLYGPPGTGKTRAAFQVAERWKQNNGHDTVQSVTFHPSYSYEDFVQGFKPNEEDASIFTLQPGVFLNICDTARKAADAARDQGTPVPNMLLIIDEINRGDTARIFGELITYIEGDKRGAPFRLAQEPTKLFSVPPNLYVLGTMNTADRSISLMDVAFRRRFAFVAFPPLPQAITSTAEWLSEVAGIDLAAVLQGINKALGEEGVEPDRAVGHAMLGISTNVDNAVLALRRRFELDIIPLVLEYCMIDRAATQRVLGNIVDARGQLQSVSDEVFLEAIRQIAARGNAQTRIGTGNQS